MEDKKTGEIVWSKGFFFMNSTAGAEKAMARSRKRAEKGLCTKEESDAFCTKSDAALKSYLDKQVKEGTITPAERKILGH